MKKYVILMVSLIILFFLENCIFVTGYIKLTGPLKKDYYYYDYQRNENWLVTQAYSVTVADVKQVIIYNPYETVIVHQACTYGLSISDGRYIYGDYYEPKVLNHKIRVEVHDKNSIPSTIRFTDPYGYTNAPPGSGADPIILYALDILWNFVVSQIRLPVPSPWQLLLKQEGNGLTITRDADAMGVTFIYVGEPTLQGADWLVYVDKPVQQGYYAIDVYSKGNVILRVYSSYEPYIWDIQVGNINILTFADFRVEFSG